MRLRAFASPRANKSGTHARPVLRCLFPPPLPSAFPRARAALKSNALIPAGRSTFAHDCLKIVDFLTGAPDVGDTLYRKNLFYWGAGAAEVIAASDVADAPTKMMRAVRLMQVRLLRQPACERFTCAG